MSPDQFDLMKELDIIEKQWNEIEMEKAMLRGYIMCGCPVMVPAGMSRRWMYTLAND